MKDKLRKILGNIFFLLSGIPIIYLGFHSEFSLNTFAKYLIIVTILFLIGVFLTPITEEKKEEYVELPEEEYFENKIVEGEE